MLTNDTVLITGAGGFLGGHLAPKLSEAGFRVLRHTHAAGDISREPLRFEGVGHVFHLAAKTFVPDSWSNPLQFYATNVLGAVNVLEFCRRRGAGLTLLSSYVYGHPRGLPISEDHPLQAPNPYSHTKILAEEAARFYEAKHEVSLTIVRPFNVYGPGQPDEFLLPMLIRQGLSDTEPSFCVNDVRPRRDYVYVGDLVDLLVRTAHDPHPGVYNAGSGRSVSIAELVDLINSCLPRPKELVSRQKERPQEILDVVADIERASQTFGWRPQVSLREGIARTVRAMEAGREPTGENRHCRSGASSEGSAPA